MPSVSGAETTIVRGRGAEVWDESGHRLIDAPASLWYCNVGHGRSEIADAVAEQMRTLAAYSTFQHYATRPALALADRLAELVPVSDPKIFMTSGGSDAVDFAAKLSIRFWQVQGREEKRLLVSRGSAYHGLHGFGTALAGLDFNRAGYSGSLPATVRVPTNDIDSLGSLLATDERIAAFYCEPVIGTGGVIPPAPGYLEGARELCRRHDVLFIADEVITGFGRAGAMFACERYGLEPDILLMAKGISSGYVPLGAVAVSGNVAEPFWRSESNLIFRHGLTYSGHAAACRASLANLEILEREDLVQRVSELEPRLSGIVSQLSSHPLVREVRAGVGLLAGVELRNSERAQRVISGCYRRGVLTRQLARSTLHISPPFVITEHALQLVGEVIAESLDQELEAHPLTAEEMHEDH